MKLKLQSGSIQKKNGGWHWRYYENGKQKSVKLADVSDEFRSKADVIPLANNLAVLQPSDGPRTGNMTVVQFAESVYLPWMQEQKRPATYSGSHRLWRGRLKEHFGERRLGEYRPYHATEYLTGLAREGLGSQVSHARALMSGIFAHAVALGHLSMNPIRDCKVLVKPKERSEGQHYTIEEMRAILAGLRSEPKALVAMSLAFMGLNRAEIRGVRWEDVDTARGIVHVRRSVWGKDNVAPCKNAKRLRDVSIGPFLSRILEQFHEAVPGSGYLLENEAGNPLELGQYSTRTIRPLFKKLGLEWKGYHAGRRGAETLMARHVNGDAQIVAHHFGHTMEVAMANYIKPVPADTRRAALALDGELAADKGQQGTVLS